MRLAGWGRYPSIEATVFTPRSIDALKSIINSKMSVIARGNGRAYGDSAINANATIKMQHFNKMISFDTKSGLLVAEAGVLLGDIINAFISRGWFLQVTPGTKYVTIGGAIAADVHGKNHHKEGSFQTCVEWIDVMGTEGEIVRCSREKHQELFSHTLGGMGLTGIIVRAAIQLRVVESAWIRQTTFEAPDLKTAMAVFEDHIDATYSVAWIDCLAEGSKLGRSLIMLGEHAQLKDLPNKLKQEPFVTKINRQMSVPLNFPSFVLNQFSVKVFNTIYYHLGSRKTSPRFVDWDSYFYPLDSILNWNKIYGSKGFIQFQCVLPLEKSAEGLKALLGEISKSKSASFLAVLKRFGKEESEFSFPMEGYTLALDFPINKKTFKQLEKLDQIVLEYGGRFYLAKDSRMSAQTMHLSDNRASHFTDMRKNNDLYEKFLSEQAERLSI